MRSVAVGAVDLNVVVGVVVDNCRADRVCVAAHLDRRAALLFLTVFELTCSVRNPVERRVGRCSRDDAAGRPARSAAGEARNALVAGKSGERSCRSCSGRVAARLQCRRLVLDAIVVVDVDRHPSPRRRCRSSGMRRSSALSPRKLFLTCCSDRSDVEVAEEHVGEVVRDVPVTVCVAFSTCTPGPRCRTTRSRRVDAGSRSRCCRRRRSCRDGTPASVGDHVPLGALGRRWRCRRSCRGHAAVVAVRAVPSRHPSAVAVRLDPDRGLAVASPRFEPPSRPARSSVPGAVALRTIRSAALRRSVSSER